MISILLNVNLGGVILFNVVTKVIKGGGRLPKSFYNQPDQLYDNKYALILHFSS